MYNLNYLDKPQKTRGQQVAHPTLAQNFMNNPPQGTLTKVRPNGDQLFYNPATNTFGSRTQSGQIKTLFKPNDKINYWNRQ